MGSRILLADDSITIQKVVNLTFADEGIEVVAVSNGEMAERRLSEVSPDLVLADIFMPGKNGYELCEAIKSNPQFRNVPVVLLVGAFEPFDQVEARRVQADTHLTKPFESRVLVETVRKLIGKTERRRATEPTPASESVGQNTLTSPMPSTPDNSSVVPVESTAVEPKAAPETMPLDLDRIAGSFSGFHSTVPEGSSDLTLDEGEAPLSFWEQPTDELISAESVETLSESGDDVLECVTSDAEALAIEPHQMVVDFEESWPASPKEDDNPSMLESSGDWQTVDVEAAADWQAEASAPGTPEPPEAQQSEISEVSLAAASSLLTTEEPLGDVLSGVRIADSTPADDDDSTLLLEQTPMSELSLDLPSDDASIASPQASHSSSERVTGELIAAELPLEAQTLVDSATQDFVASEVLDQLQHASDEQVETTSSVRQPDDEQVMAEPVSPDSGRATSEPESQTGFDAVVMPVDAVLPSFEQPIDEGATLESQPDQPVYHPVDQPRIGVSEHVEFAAIDIDASPLDQTLSQEFESSDAERGFEILQLVTAEPSGLDGAARPNLDGGYELSPVVIDEIVRRVVSQISDAVVREIAWEIVPDCVERIIDQQARDLLARR